jgi:PAS domain S-box-containing protein
MRATSVEAERRLRRERDLLHSVLDRVTDPIMLTDTEGRMVIANARAERLFATREDESEGRRRAVAINNMLFSSALGRSAVEPLPSAPHELALVDPTEGSDLLFELISTTAGDARVGMGIVSILRNVSDLRRATEEIQENYRKLRAAEAEVRAERDRLDLVIDSVADPILVTDSSGNLVMMNTPAERLFSTSENASPVETQRVQANDAHFTSFVSNLLFGKTGQSRYHGGVNLVDPKTGQQVPMEAVSGKVYGDSAEVSAIVTILHDRTEAIEREQLYEQLKAASAQLERRVQEATSALVHQNELFRRQAIELEQASVAKSQFLANVSHDVRTPLNAILGYTSLLLRGVSGPLGPTQRESLARIDANGRHLLTLINEILDISRIEAGKMPVRLSSIKLNELVDEIMSEVDPLIARSNLVVTANVPPGLAAIRSDRQKVKQILLNLLTNALKFTPRGSVTVSCTHQRSTRELAIAVADTGIGIAEADQARIFEAFSQADPTLTRETGGTGLGLSISRRLAAVLGGRITLESKLRQGSIFTLILPLGSKR